MKKLLRFTFAATMLPVFLIAIGPRQLPAQPAPISGTVSQLGPPTMPQTAALLAQIKRMPQVDDPHSQPVILGTKPTGALRFLHVQRGWQLPAGQTLARTNPAETARNFMLAHRSEFGVTNSRSALTVFRTLADSKFTAVRLQQTYGSLPVVAAEAVVHVGAAEEIRMILADLATELGPLDQRPLPLSPRIAAAEAQAQAIERVQAMTKSGPLNAADPELVVYAPDVLGLPGEPALAWQIAIESTNEPFQTRGRAIMHADTGALLNYLDDIHSFSSRRIYDDNNSATSEPTLGGQSDNAVRVEGGPPIGIAEVDNLYDFIRQIDNFYLANHQRNGFDGGGGTIYAVARDVPPGKTAPWGNATGGSNVTRFGLGFVADDIVAHEFTHCVTDATSRLLYQNASGAINESFSDIWGEFLDLTNGGQIPNGNDAASVRWEIGEDLSGGPLRSMKDPPRFNHPDRWGSNYYRPVAILPAEGNDNGGVHSNSGVSNKLCFLLTDGGSHNGQTISPEGIANTAALFYQAQVFHLTPASDWRDLYFALLSSAANLEWSGPRTFNLARACDAVEISTAAHDYYVDRSSPATAGMPPQAVQEVGIPNLVVYSNGQGAWGPYRSLPAGVAAVNDRGTLHLNGAAGTYNAGFSLLDKPMTLETYNAPTVIVP